MSFQKNNALDSLEKLKEVLRLQFDYFKQLSTLSTASIGAIIAFFSMMHPASWGAVFAGLSLIAFFVCLIVSLFGMTAPANMVLYSTAIWTIATSSEKTPEERKVDGKSYTDKYEKGIDDIKIFDRISKLAFIFGIVLFLVYAGISLICNN